MTDFCQMTEISRAELGKRICYKTERIPLGGMIELTFRCNLNCSHCYVNLAAHQTEAIREEMTFVEICHIIDQIVAEGCLWLTITGGEPLQRDDFIDIYTYAKKKGLLITLFTNGTLITPDIADYFKEWPPYRIEITLQGITKTTYERITRKSGSFEKCLRGIDLLLEREIPLELKTIVMTTNQHELPKIKSYAAELGVDFRFDALINQRLDTDKRAEKVRLSPEKVVELDLADKKKLEAWKEFWETFHRPLDNDYLYSCGAGLFSFHIDPYGKLSLCALARNPNFDLRQASFRSGYYKFFEALRAKKINKRYKCRDCELISLCGHCPGWAELENCDQETSVDYLCKIAHLRAKSLNLINSGDLKKTENKEVSSHEKEIVSQTSY